MIPSPLVCERVSFALPSKDRREVVVELFKIAEKKTSKP
jgi:hypothetical protein